MNRRRVRTWHLELAAVSSVLALVAWASGGWTSWVSAAAVALTFAHAQVADRLAEREARRAIAEVECHGRARLYFFAKESLWIVFFVATGAYAALVGCALFLAYPIWRAYYRRTHPLDRDLILGRRPPTPPAPESSGRLRVIRGGRR